MLTREWDLGIAVEVAKEEGMEEGEVRKALKIAKTMKAKGMDTNTIAEVTGLTVDDILRM